MICILFPPLAALGAHRSLGLHASIESLELWAIFSSGVFPSTAFQLHEVEATIPLYLRMMLGKLQGLLGEGRFSCV